ncbi:MAG: RidA family protein [Mucilaginibacter sp.]|uniref:RidA family protein n=1 Tax=Mucilaginibacter sp. TaxID=1882438 RepID=UPI00326681CD
MSKLVKIIPILFFTLSCFCGFGQAVKPGQPTFSNSVKSNGFLFVSGQIGADLSLVPPVSFSDETESAIKKIVEILRMNKLSTLNVVSCTVYLTDINNFEEFNNVYRKSFSPPFPSRTCVVVLQLVQKARIEISVIASLK